MRLSRILSALVGLALAGVLPTLAGDVSGKWTAQFDTQVGVQKYTFDLKAAGDKLTGSAAFERMGDKGTAELKEGRIAGDKVFFVENLDFQGNQVRIEYTGTVAGDEIKFTRKVGDFASEEFVARRVKD